MFVLVGRGGAGVRVGGGVRVSVGRGVLVNVPRDRVARAVNVTNTNGVAVGVRVRVGVGVMVKVGGGVSDTVGVGAVEVGKGPSSACDVSATAVRVLSALRSDSTRSGCRRDIRTYMPRIKPSNKSPANNSCRLSRLSLKTLKFKIAALLKRRFPHRL